MEPFRIGDVTIERVVPKSKIPEPSKKRHLDEVDSDGGVNVNNDLKIFVKPPLEDADGQQSSMDGGQTLQDLRDKMDENMEEDEESDEKMSTDEESEEDESENEALDNSRDKTTADVDIDSLVKNKTGISIVKRESSSTDIAIAKAKESAVKEGDDDDSERTDDKVDDDEDRTDMGDVQMEDEDADKEDGDDNDNDEPREETSKRKASGDGSMEGSPKAAKKKKKRKKKKKEGSGDEEKDKEESGSGSDSGSGSGSGADNKSNVERKLSNMRRNIREVMSENQLDEETLAAQRREMERLRRVQDQQKILREVARQAALNKQNAKTQTRVISLLRGSALLRQLPGASVTPAISVGPATGPASSASVLVKLAQPPAAASGAKKVIELLRVPQGGRSPLPRSLLTKPHMMTPSVSIAPVAPRAAAPDLGSSSEDEDERAREALRKVAGKPKPKGRDVVTISSSSEDDCILLSEPSSEEEPEAADDPTNSGMHTNDAYNIPDETGRVLVNVGHPEADADIFLAPQIARIIKPHQIGGIRFLFDNVVESVERFESSTGFGCILAHSMGLGKTLQVVSFCDIFLRHTPSRTVLCILPINTLQNWLAEFNMWLPDKVPEGAEPDAVRPRDFALHVLNDSHKSVTARARVIKEWSKDGGVLLIGYELYRQFSLKRSQRIKKRPRHKQAEAVVEPEDDDKTKALLDEILSALVKPGPDLVICDEGHRIKNSHASISQALKQIRSRRRIVLTGYPLQNNLLEYWCMVDFVRPNYLGTKTEFCNMFERPIQNGQCYDSTPQDVRLMRYRAHVLHSLLEGFVQRRSQQVLQLSLPQKEEYVLLLRMMPFQRKLYDTFMNEVVRTKAVPNPLKAFAVCCKIWNHPDVLYQFLKKRAGGEAVDLDLEEATAAAAGLAAAAAGGTTPAAGASPGRGGKRGRGRGSRGGTSRKDRKGGAKPAASVTPNASAAAPDAGSATPGSLPSLGPMPGNPHYPGHPYAGGPYDSIGYQHQGGQTGSGPQFPNQFPTASSSSSSVPSGYNPDGTPYGNLNFPTASQNSYPDMADGAQYHGNPHNTPSNPYNQYSNNPSTNFNPYYNPTGTGNRSAEFPDASGQSGNSYWGNQNYYSGTGATGQDGANYQNESGFPAANSISGNYQANPGTQSGGSFTQNPATGAGTYGQGSFAGGQNANYQGATQSTSNYQGQGDSATNQYYDNGSGSFGNNGFFQNQGYGNYGGGGDSQFRMNEQFANKSGENLGTTQTNSSFGASNSNQTANAGGFPNSQTSGFANANAVGQPPSATGNFAPGYGSQFPAAQNAQDFRPAEQKPNTLPGQTRGPDASNFPPSFGSQFPTTQDGFRASQFGSEAESKFSDPGNIKIENLLGMDCETPSGMFGANQTTGFGNRAPNMGHWGGDFEKDAKMADAKTEKSPLDILKDEFSVEKSVASPKSEVKATGVVVPSSTDVAKKEETEEVKEKEGEGKEGEGSPGEAKPGEAKTAQEWMAGKNGGREDPGIPYDWAVELLKNYIPGAIENSAKMDVFFLILNESVTLGDRLLVFSQSLFTLNLIEEFLQSNKLPGSEDKWARNVNYYRLDGSTTALEREKLINEYNSNPGVHLFLVSTRAGSLGINLVGANRVIVFDASWNPCHDTQAVCRVYRYGQQKPCFVYRLVMDNCLEKKIYDRQINKQGMADRVVDECNPDAHLSIKEVTNLCWDDEKDSEIADFSEGKDKYEDLVMRKLVETHSRHLSKEPFQHESLLVDRKEKKLSQAEKRLAQRSYELEKQANINYNRPQYPVTQPGLQIRAIRPDGSAAGKPVASVRPMQAEPGQSGGVRGAGLGAAAGRTRWIPAEVWQRQGMSAQEMTLPLDVVIPTNSADRASIVLKAGQRVMVLKSPKGIYMQLENGKIIAIRTAFKVGGAGKGAAQDNAKDLKATSFLHQDKDDLKKGNISITRGPKPPAPALKPGPAVSLMAKSPGGRLGPALARRPLLSRPRPPTAAATKPYRPNDDTAATAKEDGAVAAKFDAADGAKSPGSSQDTARSVDDVDSETSFDGEAAAKAVEAAKPPEKPEGDFRTDMQKLQDNVDKIQPDPSFLEEGKEEKRQPEAKKFTVERTFQKSGLPAVSVTPVSASQTANLPPTNIQQWQQKNPQYIQQAYQHAPATGSVNPSTHTTASLGPASMPTAGQNQSGYPRSGFNQSTFKSQGHGNVDQQIRMPLPDQQQIRVPDQQQMRVPDQQQMRVPDQQQMRVPDQQQMRVPDQQQMRVPDQQQMRVPDQQQMRVPDQQQMRVPDQQQMRVPDQQQMRVPAQQQMRVPDQQQTRVPLPDQQQMRVPDQQQMRLQEQHMRIPESQLPHESQQRIPETHSSQLRIPDASMMRQRESQMRLHDVKVRPQESQMRPQDSQPRIPDLTSPIPVESSDEERRSAEGATLSPRPSLKNYRHNFAHKAAEKQEAPEPPPAEKPRHVPNLTARPTKKRPPPKSKSSVPVDYQALGAVEEKPAEPPAYPGFQQGYPGFPAYPGFTGQFPNEFHNPAAAYAAEKLPEISLTRPDASHKKSEKEAKEPDTEKRKDDPSSRTGPAQPDANPYASGYPQYPGQMSAPYDQMMNGYPGQYPSAAANPFAANFRPGNPYGTGYPLTAGYPAAPAPTYGEDYARAGMYSAFHRPEPHFPNPGEIPSPFGQPFMAHHRFPGATGTQPAGYFGQNAYPAAGFAARPGFPPETGYGYQAAAAGFNPYMTGHVPMRYPGIPGATPNATMPPQ